MRELARTDRQTDRRTDRQNDYSNLAAHACRGLMTSPGDPDEIKCFNPEIKTNHYESKGTYVCELVGEQRRLLHRRRSDNSIRLAGGTCGKLALGIHK